jgi:hypothetical protein
MENDEQSREQGRRLVHDHLASRRLLTLLLRLLILLGLLISLDLLILLASIPCNHLSTN